MKEEMQETRGGLGAMGITGAATSVAEPHPKQSVRLGVVSNVSIVKETSPTSLALEGTCRLHGRVLCPCRVVPLSSFSSYAENLQSIMVIQPLRRTHANRCPVLQPRVR
jgi:hypothetical protein